MYIVIEDTGVRRVWRAEGTRARCRLGGAFLEEDGEGRRRLWKKRKQSIWDLASQGRVEPPPGFSGVGELG